MAKRQQQLSVAIIARDEERYIGGCLESIAGLADEIVVLLDDRSRDRTETLCKAYHATVYVEPWRGYPAQRNHALSVCQSEWVLFLDADERITPELWREVHHVLDQQQQQTTSPIAGYRIPRYNSFFGQIVYGGGWYPDYQLRLLRRTCASFDEQQLVHEVAILDGTEQQLGGHLLHINIERLSEFWHKQTAYALAEARILANVGRHVRHRTFVGAPAREFWRRYVQLGGWHDGALGLFLCGSLAWFEIVKYGFLLLLQSPRPQQKPNTHTHTL